MGTLTLAVALSRRTDHRSTPTRAPASGIERNGAEDDMQNQRPGGFERMADDTAIATSPLAGGMSRSQRLERWASALELRQTRCLPTIDDSGFWIRARVRRADGSPLAVAVDDWALRAEGLDGDTMADAIEFFGLSAGEMRRLLGASHHGPTVPAAAVAATLRMVAGRHQPASVPATRWMAAAASAAGVLALVLAGIPLVLASL
jgi:hypothetical protein